MKTENNGLNFTGANIYAGIDVHLKSWKVTILAEDMEHKTFVQPPDAAILGKYLQKNFPQGKYFSAYEAGFCGYSVHRELVDKGIQNIVVHAADVPTTDKEQRQKEDKRDSRKIARSLRNGDLTALYIPNADTLEDRSLLRTRAMLVKDTRRYQQRIKHFLYQYGIKYPELFQDAAKHWSKRFIQWIENIRMETESGQQSLTILLEQYMQLRKQVLAVTRQIRTLSQTEVYKENVQLMVSICGIGTLTAMKFLTELETIKRFPTLDQLCSYIGLIPSTSSSGEKDRIGNITPRGHHFLREAIIESSWIAVRKDPALMQAFLLLTKRMNKNRAIIRIAKKLLNRIVYVLKNKKPYIAGVVNGKQEGNALSVFLPVEQPDTKKEGDRLSSPSTVVTTV